MTQYCVEWYRSIEAEDPQDAANKAREIQLDPTNHANHFYVTKEGGEPEAVDAVRAHEEDK